MLYILYIYISISIYLSICLPIYIYRVSHSREGIRGARPPHTVFFETPPPIKTDGPRWAHPHLKMKPPYLKNNPLPIQT